METDSPVVYQGSYDSNFPEEIQKTFKHKFTQQEKEILRACNKESLYYRCLPFAVITMATTQLAIRRGILTSHPVWGSSFKLSGAAFAGWIIGKFSYRRTCEDKFLALENSVIGDAIRAGRGYPPRQKSEFSGSNLAEDDSELKSDSYTTHTDDYYSSSGSLNLDVDKNIQYSGLDDRERPSTDREASTSDEVEPVKRFTTYEDLRRSNREEYEKSQRSYAKPDKILQPLGQRPLSNADTPPIRRYSTDPQEGGTKNIYGDTWDNSKFL